MPNTPPGGVSAGTLQDLSLPGRAVTALTRAGVTSIEDLAALTRRELAAVPGLGPGLIAAIRLVVPEPAPGPARPDLAGPSRPGGAGGAAAGPVPAPAEEESPVAPAIPSFASLRSPGGRTPVDVLFPDPVPAPPDPAPAAPAPAPAAPSPPAAAPAPRSGPFRTGPVGAGAPRPAEYGDLLRIGRHLARAAVGVPGRVVRWSVRQPGRCLGRLLGGGTGSPGTPRS